MFFHSNGAPCIFNLFKIFDVLHGIITLLYIDLMQVCPLKILIVDDERLARRRLDDALSTITTTYPLDIVGHADNGQAALVLIEEESPDVVLLDIQMPGMSGIDVARALQHRPLRPAVIFLTAYDQYAMDAFDVEAVDYLLKPIKDERLLQALQKAKAWRTGTKLQTTATHIPAHRDGKKCMLSVDDIQVATSDWRSTRLYVGGSDAFTSDWTLLRLEEEYPHVFCRIHRATLVNLSGVQRLERTDDERWTVVMKDIAEIFPVSRRLLTEVRHRLAGK